MRVLILLALVALLEATHFRGGTVSWTRTSASNTTVTFSVIMHFFVGGVFPSASHMQLFFGDGTDFLPPSTTKFLNGTYDATSTVRTIIYDIAHTYPALQTFTAFISSAARQNAIVNGPGASYKIEAGVNLTSSWRPAWATLKASSPACSTCPFLRPVASESPPQRRGRRTWPTAGTDRRS